MGLFNPKLVCAVMRLGGGQEGGIIEMDVT